MALRLGAAFRTSPDFWMNAQKAVDLYEAAGHVQSLPRPLLKAS
jgi:plasmid maintenance system antidote protein VapI